MVDKIVILGAGVSGNGTAILAKKHGYEVFGRVYESVFVECYKDIY